MSRRLRLSISLASLMGLLATVLVAMEPHRGGLLLRGATAAFGVNIGGETVPRIRTPVTDAGVPGTESPLPAPAPGQTTAGASLYLYPQVGYPDGHGGVAHPDQVYEVYRLSNGAYWLKLAPTASPA